MRQCSINELKPGFILGQSIHTYSGDKRTLLLGRGAKLTSPIIKKLISMGYPFVYIEEKGTEDVFPEEILSEETRDKALLVISRFYGDIKKIFVKLFRENPDSFDFLRMSNLNFELSNSTQLKECVHSIIEDLFIIGSVRRYQTNLGTLRTNTIYNHVLNTAIISLLLGWKSEYTDSEQMALGMGAVLHDIGKLALPDICEKKFYELNANEQKKMRKHPLFGEKILEGSRTISEMVKQIIVQHHERQDGTGYPFGLHGTNKIPVRTNRPEQNQIFRFAEIVAVADAFDNIVSGNYQGKRFSSKEACDRLIREAGTRLNSEIVRMFLSIVNLYPVGSNVKIIKHSDSRLIGTSGVIAKSDGQDISAIEVVLLFNSRGKRIPAQKIKIYPNRNEAIDVVTS